MEVLLIHKIVVDSLGCPYRQMGFRLDIGEVSFKIVTEIEGGDIFEPPLNSLQLRAALPPCQVQAQNSKQ